MPPSDRVAHVLALASALAPAERAELIEGLARMTADAITLRPGEPPRIDGDAGAVAELRAYARALAARLA